MKRVLCMSVMVAGLFVLAGAASAQVGGISIGGGLGAAGAIPSMNQSGGGAPQPSVATGPNGASVTIPGNPESSPAPETPNIGVSSTHSVGQQPPGSAPGQTGTPGATVSAAGKVDTSDLLSLPPSGGVAVFNTGSGGEAAAHVNQSVVEGSAGSR